MSDGPVVPDDLSSVGVQQFELPRVPVELDDGPIKLRASWDVGAIFVSVWDERAHRVHFKVPHIDAETLRSAEHKALVSWSGGIVALWLDGVPVLPQALITDK